MREEGYYKVKFGDNWIIAQYKKHFRRFYRWWICGESMPLKDSDFDEIGDKIEF